MRKKNLPKLYTYSNNLDKDWYVGYRDDKGKRIRRFDGINIHKTKSKRLKAANKLLEEITKELLEKEFAKDLLLIEQKLDLQKGVWRPKTYSSYKSKFTIFRNYIATRGISKETIDAFFLEYLTYERKVEPQTYNTYIINVGMFLDYIGQKELVEDIKKRKANPKPAAYYTKTQKQFLISHIKETDETIYHFVQFMYYCFLRPNEIRQLKVCDVLLEEQKIVITGDISKNRKQQYISIPNAFMGQLSQLLQGRNPNSYVFPGNTIHSPMGANTMNRKHRRILKELHFDTDRYKLYSWKHTGAVAAVKAGIHIKQLQIQLRHHSLDQVDMYLRQLGVQDLNDLKDKFPSI